MKQLLIILLILILPIQAWGNPWLISQQYEPAEIQPDRFYLWFDDDKLEHGVSPSYDMLKRPFLLVDVEVFGLKPGHHVVRAQAAWKDEVSGMSDPFPFSWPWQRFSSPRLSILEHRPVLKLDSPMTNGTIRPPTGLMLF